MGGYRGVSLSERTENKDDVRDCNGLPPWTIKERERCSPKVSHFVEDEVLSDWNRALLLCLLHSRSVQVFGRLTLLRGTPECFQQSLHLAFGVCVCVCRRRSLSFAGLPVVTPLFTYIYIHLFCLCACGARRLFPSPRLVRLFLVPRPLWSRLILHARA